MRAIWTTFLIHRHGGSCLEANNKRGAHSFLCAPLPLGLPVQLAVPVVHGSVFYHVVQVAADDVVGCVITGTVSSDTAVVGAVVATVVGAAGSAVGGAAVCAAAGAAVSAAGGQGEHHHKRQREQAKSLHSHFSLPVFRRQKRGSAGGADLRIPPRGACRRDSMRQRPAFLSGKICGNFSPLTFRADKCLQTFSSVKMFRYAADWLL